MNQVSRKVSHKMSGFSCTVKIPVPTFDEAKAALGEDRTYKIFVDKFVIIVQDTIRRMLDAGQLSKNEKAVQETASKSLDIVSGKVRVSSVPRTVELSANKKTYTPDEVAALLASANIKVETV